MKKFQAVRKSGGGVSIAVTGIANLDEVYKIEKVDEKTIMMTRME